MGRAHPAGDLIDAYPPDTVDRLRAAGCVFAEDEARLLVADGRELDALVARRVAGEPLEQVLGWAEFDGFRVVVEPGVFVPRRRSEILVRRAAAVAPDARVVVDLCAGTGALGLAVARRLGAATELHAVDVDPVAVGCARRNGVERAVCGDLDAPLPSDLRGRVDLMIVSAPYVPTGRIALMPPEARDHEPPVALDGGADGLDVVRRVVAAAPGWLGVGGWLATEVGADQEDEAVAILAAAGLTPRVEHGDDPDDGVSVVLGEHHP